MGPGSVSVFESLAELDTLKDASRFPTWLYAIARNAVYDHWRARKETHLSWEQLEMNDFYAELPGPEEQTAEAELVRLTLDRLPAKARECLLLRVIGGFSHQEIAGIVGIGTTSVSTYISAARRQFRVVYSHLVNHHDMVISYDFISSHVWGDEEVAARQNIHVYIGRLRQKIEIPAQRRFIINESKVGYRFQTRQR
jgi:RNA polymerase sigma factor (sigma-70 family)